MIIVPAWNEFGGGCLQHALHGSEEIIAACDGCGSQTGIGQIDVATGEIRGMFRQLRSKAHGETLVVRVRDWYHWASRTRSSSVMWVILPNGMARSRAA